MFHLWYLSSRVRNSAVGPLERGSSQASKDGQSCVEQLVWFLAVALQPRFLLRQLSILNTRQDMSVRQIFRVVFEDDVSDSQPLVEAGLGETL